jgi:predicted RNase H-like nuclease (RuvC/YqgF family)
MPFNSEANDYMYAIDETNRIGYFASDRRQPEGKVCIYIFVPSETRKTYAADTYSTEKIRQLADIHRIADTWGDGTERKAALERIKAKYAATGTSGEMVSTNSQDAAVNFQSKEAKILYQDLLKEQNELNSVNARLAQLRQKFHNANASAKKVMKNEILKLEDKVLELNTNVKQLNKAIRNAEIKSKKQ